MPNLEQAATNNLRHSAKDYLASTCGCTNRARLVLNCILPRFRIPLGQITGSGLSSFASTQICLTEWTKLCSGWPTVNLRQQTSGSGDVLAKVLVHHWHGPGTCDIAPAIFPLLERFKMRRAVPLVHQHARSTRFGVVTKTKTKATRCQCVTS